MGKKNNLILQLNCDKNSAIQFISNIDDTRDYVRVSKNDNYDVCLELTWRQHSEPYIDYLYLANIENQQLIGELLKYKKNYKKSDKSIKDIIKSAFGVVVGLLMIYGMPFLLLFGFTDMLYLSLALSSIPLMLLIIIVAADGNHITAHKENIIKELSPILGNKSSVT